MNKPLTLFSLLIISACGAPSISEYPDNYKAAMMVADANAYIASAELRATVDAVTYPVISILILILGWWLLVIIYSVVTRSADDTFADVDPADIPATGKRWGGSGKWVMIPSNLASYEQLSRLVNFVSTQISYQISANPDQPLNIITKGIFTHENLTPIERCLSEGQFKQLQPLLIGYGVLNPTSNGTTITDVGVQWFEDVNQQLNPSPITALDPGLTPLSLR